MRTTVVPRLVAASVLLLALGGCTVPGSPDADAAGAKHQKTKSAPAPTREATPERTADPTAPSGDAACLVGTWETDNEGQAEIARESFVAEGLTAEVTVTGTARSEYDGSTLTTTYDAQTITSVIDVEGSTLVSVTTLDGTMTGLYSVTGARVRVTDVDAAALTYTAQNTLDGVPMDDEGIDPGLVRAGLEAGGSFTFTCSGDTLALTPVAPGVQGGAYTTELRRL